MPFATDRDLIALEPNLLDEVSFLAQQRLSVTDASVTGTTATSATADFAAAQLDTGQAVLINGVAHEVIARVDASTLTVSLPRNEPDDDPIPGEQGANLTLTARTFGPQIALVHDALLRLVGIEPDDPSNDRDESMIVTVTSLRRLEALAALERLYSAAVTLGGADNATLQAKADRYRRLFGQRRAATTVLLDVNGDGLIDERRNLGLVSLQRV